MNNAETIAQLRYRKARIEELKPLQTSSDIINLLNAEGWYVDALIEYRERHGQAPEPILP
jgi:hypothetical protein